MGMSSGSELADFFAAAAARRSRRLRGVEVEFAMIIWDLETTQLIFWESERSELTIWWLVVVEEKRLIDVLVL
jgi:hypothetical protein